MSLTPEFRVNADETADLILTNEYGVIVYTERFTGNTIYTFEKTRPRCDSKIMYMEVPDAKSRNRYEPYPGQLGASGDVVCDATDPHTKHTAVLELMPVGYRRPNAVHPTIIRVWW